MQERHKAQKVASPGESPSRSPSPTNCHTAHLEVDGAEGGAPQQRDMRQHRRCLPAKAAAVPLVLGRRHPAPAPCLRLVLICLQQLPLRIRQVQGHRRAQRMAARCPRLAVGAQQQVTQPLQLHPLICARNTCSVFGAGQAIILLSNATLSAT